MTGQTALRRVVYSGLMVEEISVSYDRNGMVEQFIGGSGSVW